MRLTNFSRYDIKEQFLSQNEAMNVGKYNFQVAIGLRTFNPYEGTDQLVSDSKLYSIVAIKNTFNAKSELSMKIARTHSCT